MNRKAVLVLLLSLSALIVFPVATSLIAASHSSVRLNIENSSYFNAASTYKPCGDPIDTPGWPTAPPSGP